MIFGGKFDRARKLQQEKMEREIEDRRRSALLKSTRGVQTIITCTDRQDAAGACADVYLRVSQQADGVAQITEESGGTTE